GGVEGVLHQAFKPVQHRVGQGVIHPLFLQRELRVRERAVTGGSGNDTFTSSDWTGAGSFVGNGGADTIAANKNAGFTLSPSMVIPNGVPAGKVSFPASFKTRMVSLVARLLR
ncbi:MAG: hypothetical protein RLZZ152_345, partial [Pseudomonadota bacterium]